MTQKNVFPAVYVLKYLQSVESRSFWRCLHNFSSVSHVVLSEFTTSECTFREITHFYLILLKVLEERDQWTQVHELVHISWAGAGTQSHFKMDHELELLDKILSSRSSSYCPPSTSKKATIFTRKLAFEEGISGDTLLIKQFAAAKCVQHTRNILADVKVGNFNSTFKTYYFMPWTGAGAGT